jgi:hypothetical protein
MGRTACTEPQCLYKSAVYLYLCLLLSIDHLFLTCSESNNLEVTYMRRSKKHGTQQKIILLIRTYKTQFHTSQVTVNKINICLVFMGRDCQGQGCFRESTTVRFL